MMKLTVKNASARVRFRKFLGGSVLKGTVYNRWDGVEPNRRMSIWSDPQNNESWPHVPSRFGEIVFVD